MFYYYLQRSRELPFSPPPPIAAPQPAATPQPAAEPEPAVRHPLETSAQSAPASLPTLDNSDSMMRESVADLIGRKAFSESVIPGHLVRRMVATVDNLPRPTAPRRMMPVQPVPGAFLASGAESAAIDPANFARYTPYVRVFESIDAHA